MMAQYVEIKTANPDSLLFYRMGDFYELFFEDAEEASRALGITLTKRGKHQGNDIPMCGVPVHAADDYLQKLIRLGYRVSVCEQTEDPAEAKKRGHKSVVRRDVVRLVTAGTLTEDNLLDAGKANFLSALARVKGAGEDGYAIAWIDISTGDFRITGSSRDRLFADIARIDPKELILSESVFYEDDLHPQFEDLALAVSPQPTVMFDSASAEKRLRDYFQIQSLDAYGTFTKAELAAASAALAYVEKTQIGQRPALTPPKRQSAERSLFIDPATRTNLELVRTLSGETSGSLYSAINRTVTGPGARLLGERLMSPLTDPDAINRRLEQVSVFVQQEALADEVRKTLRGSSDVARALGRLALERGGPRDLAAIRDGLDHAMGIKALLLANDIALLSIETEIAGLGQAPIDLFDDLSRTLAEDLPLLSRDGGFVASGVNAELDEMRALRDESRKVIAGLQAEYAELTGVKSLKIRHNNVLGYFVEVTSANSEALTSSEGRETFIHRQTMANAMRFTTNALADLESRIANAAGRALQIELADFERLRSIVVEQGAALKEVAGALARVDVAISLSVLATEQGYVRPIVDDSLAFTVAAGRHPVVEQMLRKQAQDPFVANDCDLSPESGSGGKAGLLRLLTGPNMGGKSTFLRQNALIAILAQMGSFVPAGSAHVGVVDRLFSRVGAADDLARGRSTFMVEMVETAAILNQAGERSLVILDEIGRGTATFDGLSIAWAAIEHLHEINKCRTLFATHYHELTALSDQLDRMSNVTMRVREWEGEVIFMHEVVLGAADRSYGIQVARLAGLPGAVIERARHVLEQLEETERSKPAAMMIDDLPLFSVAPQAEPKKLAENPAVEMLRTAEPDEMTPRDALEFVYALRKAVSETKN
ncbi:MAG: DNA mismatch repair protein MutS [Pseudomonadota bacterium]